MQRALRAHPGRRPLHGAREPAPGDDVARLSREHDPHHARRTPMTRTIGIVAAIAACCLHLGAPTAAGTKTRGNGGSDPDIGHNGPSSGMVPARTSRRTFVHMKTWFSIVAIAVALSPGTARAGTKVLATGQAAYAATLSQAGPLSFPTRVRVFALGAPRSVTAGFVAARPPGTDRLTPSCRRASVLREQLHVHGSLCAGGYNYTTSMECVLPAPRNSAVSLVVS